MHSRFLLSFKMILMALIPWLTPAYAQAELGRCGDLNSCWQFRNELTHEVKVTCQDSHGYFKGESWTLSPLSQTFLRLNSGWGDGLGFPEPGVQFDCLVIFKNVGAYRGSFNTIGWGDHVVWTFNENGVSVRQQTTWNPEVSDLTIFSK